jgi:hypothetical protein
MAARFYRSLKVIAFKANGIWRQRYELNKQLQDFRIDVSLRAEPHLKPHERFFIPNYHFYRTDNFPGRKGIPRNRADLHYMCDMYTWQRRVLFVGENHILSSENMLHKAYDLSGSVSRKISGREPQGTWRQDELIGGKPPVIKWLWLYDSTNVTDSPFYMQRVLLKLIYNFLYRALRHFKTYLKVSVHCTTCFDRHSSSSSV